MSLGRRKREKQSAIWIDAAALPRRGGYPFYERLNELLEGVGSTASPRKRALYSIRERGDRGWRPASISDCCW
jgi:hypothetical protein